MKGTPGGHCHVERIEAGEADPPAGTEVLLLGIHGMGCTNCANRIYNALMLAQGVVTADVALASRVARVEYDPERTGPGVLVQAVEEAGRASGHGYSADPIRTAGFTAPGDRTP
jgi:copper chaperone CopZ